MPNNKGIAVRLKKPKKNTFAQTSPCKEEEKRGVETQHHWPQEGQPLYLSLSLSLQATAYFVLFERLRVWFLRHGHEVLVKARVALFAQLVGQAPLVKSRQENVAWNLSHVRERESVCVCVCVCVCVSVPVSVSVLITGSSSRRNCEMYFCEKSSCKVGFRCFDNTRGPASVPFGKVCMGFADCKP